MRNKQARLESLENRYLLSAEYMQTFLVSDQANKALVQDPNLVDPWGIGLNPSSGDFSISDNAAGVATQYGGDVNGSPLVPSGVPVSIPGSSVTGQVANQDTSIVNGNPTTVGFTVTSGGSSAPSDFLFATNSGQISGWNANVPPPSPSGSAITEAAAAGANFTGLAFGQTTQQGAVIYAADFHNNKIDVFNASFQAVQLAGSFTDPTLPAGYAPYNIQNINGSLYVAYAAQDASHEHAVTGAGDGLIDVFDEDGNFVRRLVNNGTNSPLDAPWGMAFAPAGFGSFGSDLLVANSGDGKINVFDPQSGNFLGAILDTSGNPLVISGLRGLIVGNDVSAGNSNTVYFTADPGGTHGLFGSLASIDGSPLDSAGASFPASLGASFNGTVATFSDVNADSPGSFVTSINWGDGTVSGGIVTQIGVNQYLVRGTHAYATTGSFNIGVSIQDNHSNSSTATSIAVVTPSSGSLAASPVNFSGTTGSTFQGPVATFTDGDGNTSASAYSASITWGDGTTTAGTISAVAHGFQVVGQHAYSAAGTDHVIVAIHDSDGATATVTDTAAISTQGVLSVTPGSFAATEGVATSPTIATFTDTNAATSAVDFAAAIDWGDGDTTSGTVHGSAGRFTLSGTHTYVDEGNYTVHLTVDQTIGGTASATATLAVSVADAPLSLTAAPISTTEGQTFSGSVATFTDGNPAAPTSDFKATIDWGDGTTTTGTVSGSGGFTVAGQHAYAEGGSFTIHVSVADVGGSTASGTATATVADYPLTGSPVSISGTEGATFTGPVATFIDTDPDGGSVGEYTASIAWGDGTTTNGSVSGSAGHFTVAGSHVFVDEAAAVTVTIRDAGGASATVQSPATIADADVLSGTSGTASGIEGLPVTAPLATFHDSYTGNSASGLTASIVWGDGTTTAGTVSGGSGSFTVTGGHAYADEGTYTAHVTLRDAAPGTASATASVSIHVADAPLVANAFTAAPTETSTFTGAIASFTDGNTSAPASDFTASIDWGGGVTATGTVVAAVGGTFQVLGTHTFGEEGTSLTPTVVVHDTGGSSVTLHETIMVVDAPLNISVNPVTGTEGSAANFTVATFTDTGPLDPIGDYSATIAWGDGTSSAGTLSLNGGTFTVSGSHTYGNFGNLTLGVTASENGGATATGQAAAAIQFNGTPDQRWVNSLFLDLLGRPADSGALTYFGTIAASSRLQVAADIVGSPEYLSDEVSSLYQRYLHRSADAGGGTFFVSLLANGGTLDQVAAALAASQEFYVSQGSGTDGGFLSALFQDALGRPIDAAALQFFKQALATGTTRQQVADAVLSSAEHLADVVNGIYENLLNRAADSGGLDFWVAELQTGATQNQIIEGIAASDEFFAKSTA